MVYFPYILADFFAIFGDDDSHRSLDKLKNLKVFGQR
jgi:hypothetical protein